MINNDLTALHNALRAVPFMDRCTLLRSLGGLIRAALSASTGLRIEMSDYRPKVSVMGDYLRTINTNLTTADKLLWEILITEDEAAAIEQANDDRHDAMTER